MVGMNTLSYLVRGRKGREVILVMKVLCMRLETTEREETL